MIEFSPTCVVDVDLVDTSPNDARRVAQALVAIGAVPRLRSDATVLESFLSELHDEVIRWFVGTLPSISVATRQPRHVTFATLEISGMEAPSVYRNALEFLFDEQVLTYVTALPPHGAEAIVNLLKTDAPMLGVAEEKQGGWPLPEGRGRVGRGGRVGDRFAWEIDPTELSARFGVAGFDATGFWLPRLPMPVTLLGPGNARVRRYYSGGSQAVGHTIATDEVIVSFGFSNEEFGDWFGGLVAQSREFFHPTFTMPAAGALNEDGALKLVRARREMTRAVIVGSALLRGDRALVEQVLGVVSGELPSHYGVLAVPVDDLPSQQLSTIVISAQELLASACGCIAASAVPDDLRRRAALMLPYNPHPHAMRVARWLGRRDPKLEFVLKKFRHKPAENVRERGATPQGGLANLRRQIADLVASRGGAA